MRRGTTPTIQVKVYADLTGMEVHLALKADALIVKETGDLVIEVGDGFTLVTCTLTQSDTLALASDMSCEVQIRAYTSDGAVALATTIGSVPVSRILEDGELGGEQWSV